MSFNTYYLDDFCPIEARKDFSGDIADLALLLMSGFYLGVAGVLGYSIYRGLVNNNRRLRDRIKHNKIREVVIVRGLPGVGKDSYIYDEEVNGKVAFAKCCTDDYFMKGGKYHFNRKAINQAEAACYKQFHLYLKLSTPRIYVTNVNYQRWMYSNYVSLAESYQYSVRIVELTCEDENYLKYFNSRSRHNVPMNFSKKAFAEWEKDVNVELVEPYIGNYDGPLEGDCIPFPKVTREELDNQLEQYKNDRCIVESDEGIVESDEGIVESDEEEGQITSDTPPNTPDIKPDEPINDENEVMSDEFVVLERDESDAEDKENSFTSIRKSAFTECTNLTSIVLPTVTTVTSNEGDAEQEEPLEEVVGSGEEEEDIAPSVVDQLLDELNEYGHDQISLSNSVIVNNIDKQVIKQVNEKLLTAEYKYDSKINSNTVIISLNGETDILREKSLIGYLF